MHWSKCWIFVFYYGFIWRSGLNVVRACIILYWMWSNIVRLHLCFDYDLECSTTTRLHTFIRTPCHVCPAHMYYAYEHNNQCTRAHSNVRGAEVSISPVIVIHVHVHTHYTVCNGIHGAWCEGKKGPYGIWMGSSVRSRVSEPPNQRAFRIMQHKNAARRRYTDTHTHTSA